MNIDQSTRAEIAQLQFNGNTATISRQLDKKEYKRVNDVLVACGGKWSRSQKTHVFDGDAAEAMDGAITTGQVVTKSEMNFFPTKPEVARALVEWVVQPRLQVVPRILEPSAGNGAIAEIASQFGSTLAIEVDERHRKALAMLQATRPGMLDVLIGDFFKASLVERFDYIVGNPPFAKVLGHDAIEHFNQAHMMLVRGGTIGMIMPDSIRWRMDKRHVDFRTWLDTESAVIEPLPDDAFKHAGTAVKTVRVKLTRKN